MPSEKMKCSLCEYRTTSLKGFTNHYQLHRNVANFDFPCGVPGCSKHFHNYAAFRSHVYRDHKFVRSSSYVSDVTVSCHCQVPFCDFKCCNLAEFLAHVKTHMLENVTILCPFRNCEKSFSVKSSFTSHISRCHRDRSISNMSPEVVQPVTQVEGSNITDCRNLDESLSFTTMHNVSNAISDSDSEIDFMVTDGTETTTDRELFTRTLALFFLKLQSKCLLPASTIQNIVEEMETMHKLGLSVVLKNLSGKLLNFSVDSTEVKALLKDLFDNSPFQLSNMHELRTHDTRQTYFRTNFKYVCPTPVYLGQDNQNSPRYAQYVPIKDSLLMLFQDESVKLAYSQTHKSSANTSSEILNDITDGQAYRSNTFFMQNPSALRIILYQDSFEVANPLGSGKKKHKILAVYFSLVDFPAYSRSSVDHIQLLLLCREVDFRFFGQAAVFSELVKDLQSLEENGITLFQDQAPVLGAVVAIVGDNLGSHCIGGFCENFSSNNFVCRYCTVDRRTYGKEPYVVGKCRTREHYDEIVTKLENEASVEPCGIKFRSVFNNLQHFHVCQPGLPPCLGHDLFEGIVARDLALIIRHFVKKDKYFSYEQLNRIIQKFHYVGADADNKPCDIKENADKLGGHAVQNWCLLRLLPLLINDRVQHKDSPVWTLLLLLRQIVELTCAPAISLNQIALLKECVSDYLYWRIAVFPDEHVTPKHHYLAHYPALICQFGPLIRVWTLRFESKHGYFKNCVRKLKNFKNVCSTLADRHQLLQAYLSEGCFFSPVLAVDASIDFHIKTYSASVQAAVGGFNFKHSDTAVSQKTIYKGTTYKANMFVILSEEDDGYSVGKILFILVQNGKDMYLVVEACHAVRSVDLGILCLSDMTSTECLSIDKLLDYYPLSHYRRGSMTYVILHHAVVLPY